MGRQKQARPKRNLHATISESINTQEENNNNKKKKPRRVVISEEIDEIDCNDSISVDDESNSLSLEELFEKAVDNLFSDDSDVIRKVQDPSHLDAIIQWLLNSNGSTVNGTHVIKAILDFEMLEMYVRRQTKAALEPKSHCIFRQCLKSGNLSFEVLFFLTSMAYERASPMVVLDNLLGTNNVERRRNKALPATLYLRRALSAFYPNTLIDAINSDPAGKNADPIQARFVYGLVDNVRINSKFSESIESIKTNVPGLRPTMRIYQAHAVQWMISRESAIQNDDLTWKVCWVVIDNGSKITSLVDYAERFRADSNHPFILFNPFAGWLSHSIAEARNVTVGYGSRGIRGGILADSMGLGKTVEVLACILSHPRSVEDVTKLSNGGSLIEAESIDLSGGTEENSGVAESNSSEQCVPPETVVNVERDKSPGKNIEGGVARIIKAYRGRKDTQSTFLYDIKYVIGAKKETGITRSMFSILSTETRKESSTVHLKCYICERDTIEEAEGVRCVDCKRYVHCECFGFTKESEIPESRQFSSLQCPYCSYKRYSQSPIRSRGTLIVTPPSILEQWSTEIHRHCSKSLKIVAYPGLKKLRDFTKSIDVKERRLALSHVLADADIVLTTFAVLNKELAHSDNPHMEKYRHFPSPLNSIEWWRICLDEAQRVQGTAAAAAKMALRLNACNRWCVTGTPIGRGKLEDLYGLLLFIGVMPFQEKKWFRHCLHRSHPGIDQRIQNLLYPFFWRSTKANDTIRKQLGIPEQIEVKRVLEFSSIERHFYKKQLENTIFALNDPSTAKRKTDDISSRLHILRAACCHPQVGSSGIQKISKNMTSSLADRVLSMQQILDKLIDDARLKCEESQRIAIMHTNALACVSKLKNELKQWKDTPIRIEESEQKLLSDSANFYFEALELTDTNAKPDKIIGEAQLNGCKSFLNTGTFIRNGEANLKWRLKLENKNALPSVWANTDFMIGKKLTAFKVRPFFETSLHSNTDAVLVPNECVLQVSLASLGGAFVEVRRFAFGTSPDRWSKWLSFEGIRSKRSKTWRIVIESFHKNAYKDACSNFENASFAHIGLEIQLMEPSVGADDLQRMHILHNSSLVVESLIQIQSASMQSLSNSHYYTALDNLTTKLKDVNSDLAALESNYLGAAKANHRTSHLHLKSLVGQQSDLELELIQLSDNINAPMWKDLWWQDLLSYLQVEATTSSQGGENLCAMVKNDLYDLFNGRFDVGETRFPQFGSIFGLLVALKSRKEEHFCTRMSISKILALNENPREGEILENSSCRKCRADWFQTGPKCSHCKLEEALNKYQKAFDDKVFWTIIQTIFRWLNDARPNHFLSNVKDRAVAYFKLRECEKKELAAAKRHWMMHFDLLSDYDELNTCKSTMRLPRPNEPIHLLPRHERDSVVDPRNIPALIMDHRSKQAGALAALRRDCASLRYLKNQSIEQSQSQDKITDLPSCPVCLMEFNVDDRAVLKCGHSLHVKCIDEILRRSGGSTTIRCPMKCINTTRKSEILIAASESLLDPNGGKSRKRIEGSWGTKVDRLIADILDVIENGERCIVFSQWDDLLSIIESALSANKIKFTHPKSASTFGLSVQSLRSSCHVMLLNVKRGAEGLTLVEATHVFMVEPLLHCGLDAQAINRVHRIGQTGKTYVHRYLIKDTIEERIDAIRMDRQATFENIEEEDSAVAATKVTKGKIRAGGLDGGFTSEELKHVLSTL